MMKGPNRQAQTRGNAPHPRSLRSLDLSPRAGRGENAISFSRRDSRPRFCLPPPSHEDSPPLSRMIPEKLALGLDPRVASGFRMRIVRTKKGGGAPTGASSRGRTLHSFSLFLGRVGRGFGSAPRQRMLPLASASGALASRRSTAALAEATERFGSAQAALHAHQRTGRYPRHYARLSGAPRAPVVMPEGTMPGPPGSGVTSPARRNRTRPIQRLSPVDVPEVSEI